MPIIDTIKTFFSNRKNRPHALKYIKDEPDYSHLSCRKAYKAMYDEVGTIKANTMIVWREEWMKHFHPTPQATILELGAHNGPNLLHYARLGHCVDGVEISDTLIKTYQKYRRREPRDVQQRMHMVQEWIEDFHPTKDYDYVLCTEILEHVADPLAVLRKAAQCVKHGGLIYISSPSTHWGNNTHVRGVPADALSEWLNDVNLNIKEIFEEHNRTFCYAYK